jgi:hypothetical protein
MKSKLYTLVILLTGTILISCKSASKLYDKGNYDEAVAVAAKKLQKKPGDAELQGIIKAAYQNAVSVHESNIRSHSNSSNELKWEWIYNEYAALQNLYNLTRDNMEIARIVHPIDYSSYLETYGTRAADTRLERGDDWFADNNRQSYKKAYYEYKAAARFKPADLTITRKIQDAYDAAVVNVVVLSMNNDFNRYSSYNSNTTYANRDLDNEVLRNLRYNTGSDFVRFYSEWEARSQDVRADQFIDMRFRNFNMGRSHDNNSIREVSKRIVVKETVYRPDSIVYEYKDVKARITTTKRTMLSEGFLEINVRDQDGRWLWSDNLRGEHNWYTEFSTYTGDERALSDADKQLVNRRPGNAPYQDEIFRTIINNIDNDVVGRLRSFYNRF